MKRVLLPLLLAAPGCYQPPPPLDARAVLDELRAEEAAERAERARGGHATAGDASAPLTVEAAVERALRDNPDLRVLRRQRGIAEGEIVAAEAVSNPTLDLQLLHAQAIGSSTGSPGVGVGLGWDPPQPGVYGARVDAARDQAKAVRADIAEAEIGVAAQVRAAHANLLAIAEQRAMVGEAIALRRRVRDLVEKRVQGGASTRIELGLADLSVTQLLRDLDDLAAREIAAGRELADLLGAPRAVAATGALPAGQLAPPAADALLDAAIDARPALAAARARFAQREDLVRLEYARRLPWFQITALPRYRLNETNSYPHDLSFGIQLVLPVLNLNRGPILVAEAQREQERERFRRLVGGLRRELASAADEIELRRRTLDRYRESVLPALAAQEKLLADAAAGGQLDVVAVLTAQDAILRSRREFIDVKLSLHRAWLSLERAVGRPIVVGGSTEPAAR